MPAPIGQPPWDPPAATQEPGTADERAALAGFLDSGRATLLVACAGIDGAALARRACPPSTLSLLGLLRHLADVERAWFRRTLDGQDAPPIFYASRQDWDDQFDLVDPAQAPRELATYLAEVDAAREVAARYELTDTATTRQGDVVTLRWIMLHMIEEYSRHNGHADLIREAIDGSRGQ